jgi:hypothetical protein
MQGTLWVDLVGDLIVARFRGEPSIDLIKECHDQVLILAKESDRKKVLYDVLEMEPPPLSVPMAQWKLNEAFGSTEIRRAIVVPNSKLAFLARVAFGDGNYKVFYSDLTAAIKWLNE